jgi:hypothetical protein
VSDQDTYRRADVLWRRTYDRIIILVPASGEMVTLQATARDLWMALEAPASLRELAERLASIYEASSERIAADIAPALEELSRRGAVSRCQ